MSFNPTLSSDALTALFRLLGRDAMPLQVDGTLTFGDIRAIIADINAAPQDLRSLLEEAALDGLIKDKDVEALLDTASADASELTIPSFYNFLIQSAIRHIGDAGIKLVDPELIVRAVAQVEQYSEFVNDEFYALLLEKVAPVLSYKPLLLYNMFPRQFGSIDRMTEYLPQLQYMGFNAVWLNPIQLPSLGTIPATVLEETDSRTGIKEGNWAKGSLYAMSSPWDINPDFSTVKDRDQLDTQTVRAADISSIQRFTTRCKELGIQPLFDLVLGHMAADAPMLLSDDPALLKRGIRTTQWFDGPSPVFPDVIKFRYDDPAIREQIIDHLWKPFIDHYIDTLGFEGVRVDAVAHVPPDVQEELFEYIKYKCSAKYARYQQYGNQADISLSPNPVILSELLFTGPDPQPTVGQLRGRGATHVTNSSYWGNSDVTSRAGDGWRGKENWLPHNIGMFQQIVKQRKDHAVIHNPPGGTIGFSGNHDELPLGLAVMRDMALLRMVPTDRELYTAWEKEDYFDPICNCLVSPKEMEMKGIINHYMDMIEAEVLQKNPETLKEIETRMKEKIAFVATMSDAGYYLLSGDEIGELNPKGVFTKADGSPFYAQTDLLGEKTPLFDLRDYIRDLNLALAKMPSAEFPSWTECVVLPEKPELFIAIRHNGDRFEGATDVVVVNVDGSKRSTLTAADKERIATLSKANSRNSPLAYEAVQEARWNLIGVENNLTIGIHAARLAEKDGTARQIC